MNAIPQRRSGASAIPAPATNDMTYLRGTNDRLFRITLEL